MTKYASRPAMCVEGESACKDRGKQSLAVWFWNELTQRTADYVSPCAHASAAQRTAGKVLVTVEVVPRREVVRRLWSRHVEEVRQLTCH